MTRIEIANRVHATSAATAWSVQGYDGRIHFAAVIAAFVPAVGILAVAASLLLGVL